MFPRRERLSRTAISKALTASRRLSSAHFTAILPRNTKGYAVLVSKKIARLSVTRHRLKRRVLEALRAHTLPTALILFPKSSALQLDSRRMKEELAALLSKIRS